MRCDTAAPSILELGVFVICLGQWRLTVYAWRSFFLNLVWTSLNVVDLGRSRQIWIRTLSVSWKFEKKHLQDSVKQWCPKQQQPHQAIKKVTKQRPQINHKSIQNHQNSTPNRFVLFEATWSILGPVLASTVFWRGAKMNHFIKKDAQEGVLKKHDVWIDFTCSNERLW